MLSEGELLQIVEQTRSSVAEVQGFESLWRLQNNYDAQYVYLVTIVFRNIVDWSPEMGPKFGNQFEELEKTTVQYQAISGKSLDESVALAALTNVPMKT